MLIKDYLHYDGPIKDIAELSMFGESSEVKLRTALEPAPGYFIAESAKVVERAIAAGYAIESFLVDEDEYKAEAKALIAKHDEIPAYLVAHDCYKTLTGFEVTRGLLALCRRKAMDSFRETIKNARRVAVLEDVMNPSNLGAIFRSAAALNMDAVLMTAGCTDPLYRRAARVSMGTVFQVPWGMFTKEESADSNYVELLKKEGFTTVAMALADNTVDIDNPVLQEKEKLAIILGTEGEGLASKTIHTTDFTVKIPMSNGVDSLNVAAASAVAFWELGKK